MRFFACCCGKYVKARTIGKRYQLVNCFYYFVCKEIWGLSFHWIVDRSQGFCLLSVTTSTKKILGFKDRATFISEQTLQSSTKNAIRPLYAMSDLWLNINACVVRMKGLVGTFFSSWFIMSSKSYSVVLNWDSTDIALQKLSNHHLQKRTFSTKSNRNCLHKY